LEAIASVAFCVPPVLGENVTVNVQFWPSGTLLHGVGTKSPELDVMPAMVRVAVPVLEITSGAEVELLPTGFAGTLFDCWNVSRACSGVLGANCPGEMAPSQLPNCQ
jgi:hypothetical protein